MSTYVGVDWAGGVWVLVAIEGNSVEIHTEPTILNAWNEYNADEVFLIDVPIGLPETGTRACDIEASDYLRSKHSTVFTVPPRRTVYTRGYEEAKDAAAAAGSDALGAQSWWFIPQIKEVDGFLQGHPRAQAQFYESHPEVCFTKLAGGDLLPKKATEAGSKRRLELLTEMYPELAQEVSKFVKGRSESAQWHHRIQSGRIDDVIDAAVLAFTGKQLNLTVDSKKPYPSYPADETPKDGTGLPMEIVYPQKADC